MKLVRMTMPGTMFTDRLDEVEEDLGVAAALHALEDAGAGVLEGDVEVLGDVVVVRWRGLEQVRRDLIGVGVEEAQPAEAGQDGECVEEGGEAVSKAEVFAVAGGVLADEGDLADAPRAMRFSASAMMEDMRRERNLPRSLRDDAEAAGMVAGLRRS